MSTSLSTPVNIEVTVEHDGHDTAVVAVLGDLEAATAARVGEALTGVIVDDRPATLVLDLGGVGFIDSAGLGEIVRAQRNLSHHGGRLVLRSANETTRTLLAVTHLAGQLDLR
jgi:anti-sigma B factor antagonist